MPRIRWFLSLLLAWHVVAIVIAAMPSPDRLNAIGPPREVDGNLLQRRLTPALDRAALSVWKVQATVWRAVAPLRRVATAYVRAFGLRHDWNMFANPGENDQYVRVRYFVDAGPSAESTQVTEELIFPAHPEYEPRLLNSYGVKHRDKAIDTALENFYEQRVRLNRRRQGVAADQPDDLAPVLRYFVRQFERVHLTDPEKVTRSEVWVGRAPARPSPKRLEILKTYDRASDRTRPASAWTLVSRGFETEADIQWRLEYFEDR